MKSCSEIRGFPGHGLAGIEATFHQGFKGLERFNLGLEPRAIDPDTDWMAPPTPLDCILRLAAVEEIGLDVSDPEALPFGHRVADHLVAPRGKTARDRSGSGDNGSGEKPRRAAFIGHAVPPMKKPFGAFKRAGYSKKSATVIGYENTIKHHISKRIQELLAARAERVEAKGDDVVDLYRRRAFADIGAFLDYDAKGLRLTASKDLTREQRQCVRQLKQKVAADGPETVRRSSRRAPPGGPGAPLWTRRRPDRAGPL